MKNKLLDKLYTKPEVAKKCINLIPNIETYEQIIEPSAGNGSFSNQLICIAIDIQPDNKSIQKQDYLKYNFNKTLKTLVIGNPPFGERSSVAKNFIKHSIKEGAYTIAFILPNTFKKVGNQSFSLFPMEWKLILVEELPKDSFFISNGDSYHVPCSFFVWTRGESNIDLRKKKIEELPDFSFCKRNDKKADLCVNGNSGKVKEIFEITNPKAEHFIKAGTKTKEELKNIFSKLEYNRYSSVNGGNYWIGRQEILEAYQKFLVDFPNKT